MAAQPNRIQMTHSPMVSHVMERTKKMHGHMKNAGDHVSKALSFLRPRLLGAFTPAKSVPEHNKRVANATKSLMFAVGRNNPGEVARRRDELARALHSLQTVYFQMESEFRQACREIEQAREEIK